MDTFEAYLEQVVCLTRNDLIIYGLCTASLLYFMIEITDIIVSRCRKKRRDQNHGGSGQ